MSHFEVANTWAYLDHEGNASYIPWLCIIVYNMFLVWAQDVNYLRYVNTSIINLKQQQHSLGVCVYTMVVYSLQYVLVWSCVCMPWLCIAYNMF